VIVLMMTSLAGCSSKVASQSSDVEDYPFCTDRVATIRLIMKQQNWANLLKNAYSQEYTPADFWFDGEFIPNVGLRAKGYSTLGQAVLWGSPRIPLCIDFNLFNKARSFHGIKKIFLNNGWGDPTLIRDMVGYELFRKMGVPAPRAMIVDLWVNDVRLGVYTMAEVVDTSFLARNFGDSSGNLYKPELMAARLDWTEDDLNRQLLRQKYAKNTTTTPVPSENLNINIGGGRLLDILRAMDAEDEVMGYTSSPPIQDSPMGIPPTVTPANYLEAMALKTNENNPDYSTLFRFLGVLNDEPDATFPTEIEKVLDVDNALRFIAVSAVTVHLDNYIGMGHNNYLYEINGKFTIIAADLNMVFGSFSNGIPKDGLINYYIDEPTTAQVKRFPLVDRLLSYPPYMEKYHRYIEEFLEEAFALDTIEARVNQLAEMVRPFAETDQEYFYAPGDFTRCLTEDLRPPDIFEGWMAGGMSPMLPWVSGSELSRLRQYFPEAMSLYDLMNVRLTTEDLRNIESCVNKKTYEAFLQNVYGPLMTPQPPGQSGFGPNSLGVLTFLKARYESVRQQLAGERPSKSGRGAGNGGSLWLVDFMPK
jgi:hypothetical protein